MFGASTTKTKKNRAVRFPPLGYSCSVRFGVFVGVSYMEQRTSKNLYGCTQVSGLEFFQVVNPLLSNWGETLIY
jgi:hypothetical protein